MRATAATISVLLLLAVIFIVSNLEPTTISFFGLVLISQPLGVVVSVAFLSGALIVFFLKAGVELRQTWRERHQKKTSKASAEAAASYQAGLEATVRGDLKEAREAFEQVLKQDPDHVGALLALGNLERGSGEAEVAIKRHITANARKPGSADVLRALSEDYAMAGRVDECIRALEDLLAVSPNDQHALKKKRDVYESAGRFEEAIEAHRALLKTGAPDDGRLVALRLKASLAASTPIKARAHLEAALQHDKKSAAAYKILGEFFWQEDNVADATKAWKGGWKATEDTTLLQRLCEVYVASGQGKKALKLCRQARAAQPNDPLPILLYAQTALQLEDFPEAENALNSQLIAAHPAASLLRLELDRKAGDTETLSDRTRAALAALNSLAKPYECSMCGKALDEWRPQCPSCKHWDAIRLTWVGSLALLEDQPHEVLETEAPPNLETEEQSPT